MNDNTILEIAQRYAAHADSTISIRGNEDVLAFARALFAVQQEAGEVRPESKPFERRTGEGAFACMETIAKALTVMPEIKQAMLQAVTDPLKMHEVFEHDQQCDDMAGVPSASTEEPIAVTPMREVVNELIASVAECFGVAQASQLLRDVACVSFRDEISHRHFDAVAHACEALHKVGHSATGRKVWHFFPNGELRHIALANI